LQVPLIGEFNLSNVLAVLATLAVLKIPLADALQALSHVKSVPGRMQVLGGDQQPLVIVDYAHTPDALEKTLMAVRQHCRGQLFCVMGCGGDRDKGKRPLMARIAEQYADRIVVTDDNPRHEPPARIVADIMQGFSDPTRIIIQHDRSQAIEYVIQCAVAGDCIVIAGKGAETWQQIGDEKIAFSDVEKVRGILNVILVK
jgi:UDP-N-acetylmuramoyl-L-alanyl-D-glutamate--2,6-diaminopimelate ligase